MEDESYHIIQALISGLCIENQRKSLLKINKNFNITFARVPFFGGTTLPVQQTIIHTS